MAAASDPTAIEMDSAVAWTRARSGMVGDHISVERPDMADITSPEASGPSSASLPLRFAPTAGPWLSESARNTTPAAWWTAPLSAPPFAPAEAPITVGVTRASPPAGPPTPSEVHGRRGSLGPSTVPGASPWSRLWGGAEPSTRPTGECRALPWWLVR